MSWIQGEGDQGDVVVPGMILVAQNRVVPEAVSSIWLHVLQLVSILI